MVLYTPGLHAQDSRSRFDTTRWSLVLAATGDGSSRADEALGALCEAYWPPLYAYLRGRGYAPDTAQDLTQAFFARLLEREKWVLRQADPARGRFRSFLLVSLKNFVANEDDRSRAEKRGGRVELLSLDFEAAEGRLQLEPATDETPDRVFDRRWAVTLLGRAMARLRDQMARVDKASHFDHLKTYLTGDRQASYAETAARLGMSEGAVKVAVYRLRGQFRGLVRAEIMETVSSPDEVEDEMRHLWSAVAR